MCSFVLFYQKSDKEKSTDLCRMVSCDVGYYDQPLNARRMQAPVRNVPQRLQFSKPVSIDRAVVEGKDFSWFPSSCEVYQDDKPTNQGSNPCQGPCLDITNNLGRLLSKDWTSFTHAWSPRTERTRNHYKFQK